MFRISFRQSMLAGFLLIAVLLSWAAIQSWLTLEHFVAQSQRDSAQALELNTAIQELAERTVDLERSARQFLVLNDPVLLKRFDEHAALALTAVGRLEALPDAALGELPRDWRANLEQLGAGLHRLADKDQLQPFLKRLGDLNGTLDRRRARSERRALRCRRRGPGQRLGSRRSPFAGRRRQSETGFGISEPERKADERRDPGRSA